MKLRARRDEDKVERVGAILAAAEEIWSRSSWNGFNVNEVAERAGIVKGTLYLYFPSKERLLLAVFESLFEQFFDDVDRALETPRRRWSVELVAELFAKSLRGRDSFLRIFPILGAILEHNVDYQAALAFKRFTLAQLMKTATLVEERLPAMRPGDGFRFLVRARAMMSGLAGMAFPAPVIEQIFHDERELRILRVDLHAEIFGALTMLLQAESGKQKAEGYKD